MVSFYTAERGLVEAVARGIGKPGSSLAAAVEPFTLAKLFFIEGKGADRLTQARVIEPFYPLRRDMTRYGYAAVACELIMRSTEAGQIVPGLFERLVEYLHAMEETTDPRKLSWAFELGYLQIGGLEPVLDRCAQCGCESLGGIYVASQGGVVCHDCAPPGGSTPTISAGTVKTLQAMGSFDLRRLERLRISEPSHREIERLLGDHIRYHLDISLKSEKFVDGLDQWQSSTRRGKRPDLPEGDADDE